MSKQFQIFVKRKHHKYCFVITNSAGTECLETIHVATKEECANLLQLLKRFGIHEENYLRMVSPHNEYYFLLRDDDGKLIATGNNHSLLVQRNQTIVSLLRYFNNASLFLSQFQELK